MQATETTLQKVLTGTRVFELPFFQRRYRWSGKNWEELWEDLVEQYDHPDVVAGTLPANQGHFLGSIVLHPASGPVSTVARYLLVDGQQRITTFLALLAAFRDFRSSKNRTWNPAAYNDLYLTNPYNPERPYRLVPTVKDRDAYRLSLHDGQPTGQIGRAYRFFLREIRRLASRDGELDFIRFENALLLRMLVVEITTSPGDDVNHIFHTLNASGENLSPLDLVRNHTFMQIHEERAEACHHMWLQIESDLGEARMERYLWAQFVRTNPKASQRNLYTAYQQRLKMLAEIRSARMHEVVESELQRLEAEAVLFEVIENPDLDWDSDPRAAIPPAVLAQLRELSAWGSQVHLPLSLELLSRWRWQMVDEASITESFRHILSYLVRRALCAIPTNNLNRIFAGIPVALHDDPDVAGQVAQLLSSEQRYWPTDRQVLERTPTTPLQLGSRGDQVRFILTRIEAALIGSEQPVDGSWVVHHVLPPRLTTHWRDYLSEHDNEGPDEALTRTHTLGNLVLIPSGLKVGSSSFSDQRELIPSTLRINEPVVTADHWTTSAIAKRSELLARAAIQIWQRPKGIETYDELDWASRLTEVLLEMPEDEWTTIDALAEFLAVRPDTLMAALDQLDPVLAVKVLGPDGRLPEWLSQHQRERLSSQLEESGYDVGGAIYASPDPLSAGQMQDMLERSQGIEG